MRGPKIYLGAISDTNKIEAVHGRGRTYLTKHSWDCDWYWGFGYLGNHGCHWHLDALLHGPAPTDVNKIFDKFTWLTQDQWWIIRDVFIQAYALKAAAESYRYGGHQTQQAGPYRITNTRRAAAINRDLGKLLDQFWVTLGEWLPERYRRTN